MTAWVMDMEFILMKSCFNLQKIVNDMLIPVRCGLETPSNDKIHGICFYKISFILQIFM